MGVVFTSISTQNAQIAVFLFPLNRNPKFFDKGLESFNVFFFFGGGGVIFIYSFDLIFVETKLIIFSVN